MSSITNQILYNEDIDLRATDIEQLSSSSTAIINSLPSFADRPKQNVKAERGPPKNDKSVVAVACSDPPTSPRRSTPSSADDRVPSELWRSVGNLTNYHSSDDSVPAAETAPPTESKTSSSSSDGSFLPQNDPFAGKLRNTTELRRNRTAPPADHHWFLPASAAATSSDLSPDDVTASRGGLQEERPRDEWHERVQYRQFTQRFHWLENIEHGSAWVRHRSREIADHVDRCGLFGTSDSSSEESSRGFGSDVIAVDREDGESDDASSAITYGVAKKFCDELTKVYPVKNDDGNSCASENVQCTSNERGKWAKLYRKLVNCTCNGQH